MQPVQKENPGAKSENAPFSNPVFVIGLYRSGTSLLYALLNQHPQVALMFECNVWDFPEPFAWMRFRNDWLQRQEFYNQALSRHRLTFGGSRRGLEDICAPEDLYRAFSAGKDKALFGEKSPFYCARLRRLVRHYPGCRFILLWRDHFEVCRSVVRAARKERFFRRRGFLSRLIFYREQMIHQAAELERAGVLLCHVTYDGLTEDTETTCRRICRFLDIEFDEKMLDLASADLSAVYPGPEHNQLRGGKIERQRFSGEKEILDPEVIRKLQRFDARWQRLRRQWLGHQVGLAAGGEPPLVERLYHQMAGAFFHALDDGKRLLFEFLPLAWLRAYRLTKKWYSAQRAELPADHCSFGRQFRAHWVTILASAAALAFVGCVDLITGPHVSLLPFYLLPCAAVTLVINHRWGTFAVAAATVIWSVGQIHGNSDLNLAVWGGLLWNAGMRFLLLQIVVLLLNRVRVAAALAGGSA